MTQDTIAAACEGQILVPATSEGPIVSGYTSDMLSDVMANASENSVLITIQNHNNTIAVCTLVGIKTVIVCHGRPIPEDMMKSAASEGVGIISTNLSQFAASCAIGKVLPPAILEI